MSKKLFFVRMKFVKHGQEIFFHEHEINNVFMKFKNEASKFKNEASKFKNEASKFVKRSF